MKWFEGFWQQRPENHSSSKEHQKERRNEQATAAAIDRLTNQIKAAVAEEKTEDSDGAFREKVTIGLIFLTFIAALAGDYIFYSTMRDARNSARTQHADTQSALTEDDRAWIAPEVVTFTKPIDAKPNFVVSLSFQDVGREPALNVQQFVQANIFDKTGPLSTRPLNIAFLSPIPAVLEAYCDRNMSPQSVSVTYPGDATTGSISATPKTPYDFPDVASGNGVAVVNGCFRYVTFKDVRYSIFCQFLVTDLSSPPATWTWRNCGHGNFAD